MHVIDVTCVAGCEFPWMWDVPAAAVRHAECAPSLPTEGSNG